MKSIKSFNLFPGKISVLVLLLATSAVLGHTPSKYAKVFFVGLEDGAVVSSPFQVKVGMKGFGIASAGATGKIRHTAGHHHLPVDMEKLPAMDGMIPRDEQHLHLDNGETEVTLPPDRHTLQLLLGDEQHEPQDPPLLSEKLTIAVK